MLFALLGSLSAFLPSSAEAQFLEEPLKLSYVELSVATAWTESFSINGNFQRAVYVSNTGTRAIGPGVEVRLETLDANDRLVGLVVMQAPDVASGYFTRTYPGAWYRWVPTTRPGRQYRVNPGLPAPTEMTVELPFALQPGDRALVSVAVSGTPRFFRATVDPNKRIREASEANNSGLGMHFGDIPQ